MKKNEECKIVRDLLPSCVDKVTNEVTNEFIQNHIQGCEECKKILENMGEELILDKVKEKEKLDYLKKVRRKQGIKIAVVTTILLIMVASAVIFCMFMATAEPYIDYEKGKVDYMKSFLYWVGVGYYFDDTIDEEVRNWKPQRSHISYIITIGKWDDKTKFTQIFTFDDEKDICLGMKAIFESSDREVIETKYREYKEYESQQREEPSLIDILNVEIKDGKLIYTMNQYTGISTQRVKEVIELYRKSGCEVIEI